MVPRVFISSTAEDLREYRRAAKDAALKSGFFPDLSEHWPSGSEPTLAACLERVSRCDLLVVMVAHRFGWVPSGQPEGTRKSITWLECERAVAEGKEVLAFVVDPEASWPKEEYEEYEAVRLMLTEPDPSPQHLLEIRRSVLALQDFKQWLASRAIRAVFRSPESLYGEVIAALNDWRIRHAPALGGTDDEIAQEADPERSLKALYESTRFIDIRGLQVGAGKAYQFPIEDLYLPPRLGGYGAGAEGLDRQDYGELHTLLRRRNVMVIGDPGGGKTTLLRFLANTLALAHLRLDPGAPRTRLGIEDEPPFPIFLRMADLASFVERTSGAGGSLPTSMSSPEWLVRFLAQLALENAWGLDADFYRRLLKDRDCLVLLDGLDEAASEGNRRLLARLVETAAATYDRCRFIATSRPKAYVAETHFNDFEVVQIRPLSVEAIRAFLQHWCNGLFPGSPQRTTEHREELERALSTRPEIRSMATNPVMLTALAVVHWNARRLPEQRAELYEAVITWLSRAREHRQGRLSAEQCVRLLQSIALAMQDHPLGRQTKVSRDWAAERIASEFAAETAEGIELAKRFLQEEELDSGIVVARGNDLQFWHLSFQEYLAARALAALPERSQNRILLRQAKIHASEWRESVRLFAGILHRQGSLKLDAMIDSILELAALAGRPVAENARIVGLLGAIQRDLEPLGYRIRHPALDALIQEVLAILSSERESSVPLEIRLDAADALGQAGDPRLVGDPWVRVEGGTGLVGAQASDFTAPGFDAASLAVEHPPRWIESPSFRIARFPTTVAEYERFIVDGGYTDAGYWRAGGFGRWTDPDDWDNQRHYPNRPVVGISWYEAMAYCAWRGEETALPTEAEWERASRGLQGRRFPWGDAEPSPDRLNFAASQIGHITPVGFYPLGATPEGIFDMAGNVFEWCRSDPVEPTDAGDGVTNTDQSPTRGARSVRGGCFQLGRLFARSASRGSYAADTRADFIGFRIYQGS